MQQKAEELLMELITLNGVIYCRYRLATFNEVRDIIINKPYCNILSEIGRICVDSRSGLSEEHRGVSYIQGRLQQNGIKVSKTQIKSMKKLYKRIKKYEFVLPYSAGYIISEIIQIFKENEEFIQLPIFKTGQSFRSVLIGRHYAELIGSVNRSDNNKMRALMSELEVITTLIGD